MFFSVLLLADWLVIFIGRAYQPWLRLRRTLSRAFSGGSVVPYVL